MALNERAFVEPPTLEVNDGVYTVTVHTYHWNAHPSFGSSKHTFVFEGFTDALDYMNHLGFTIKEM